MRRTKDNKISYIRRPLADHGGYCLGTSIVAVLAGIAGMILSIRSAGNAPGIAISLCFTSLVFAAAAVWFGIQSFREKEKNYILARIGLAVGGVALILWVMIIVVGGRAALG